ncbi:hypothetical protein [Vibrio owensii]
MLIHYHGGPMWGYVDIGAANKVWCGDVLYKDSCALVSYADPRQLKKIAPIAKSLVLDNGAFTFYQRGVVADDDHWAGFYALVLAWYSRIDWFIIPDVIGGSEEDNDALLSQVPAQFRDKAVPVWHSNESLDRLSRLCEQFERVAIGLVREHKPASSKKASQVLDMVFDHVYEVNAYTTKLHGLAMLDGRVIGNYPFDSADSAFVAINVPKDRENMPEVKCKLARTAIYKGKIEQVIPPSISEWRTQVGKTIPLF